MSSARHPLPVEQFFAGNCLSNSLDVAKRVFIATTKCVGWSCFQSRLLVKFTDTTLKQTLNLLGIDDAVRKLKYFQRDTNTTFIVISSFNRTNYAQSVSFECFKESDNIEYTADVVWVL